ncbi:MAG: DUF1116 domain-containing protein [Armatimonadota bacterium]
MNLLKENLKVVNVGIEEFKEGLEVQGIEYINVNWKPPCGGDVKLLHAVKTIREKNTVDKANEEAVKRIKESVPFLTGAGKAVEVIPGMHKALILHAGPPLAWKDMNYAMKSAVAGALIFEGLAETKDGVKLLVEQGEIEFAPSYDYNCAVHAYGIISASMPVWVFENHPYGNKAYSPINESSEKMLCCGDNSPEVIANLAWMKDRLLPVISVSFTEKVNIKEIIDEAFKMGDELHIRNEAASGILIRKIASSVVSTDFPKEDLAEVVSFITRRGDLFLNIALGAARVIIDSARDIEGSSVVTSMASNGSEFGIRVSGLKNQWFTSSVKLKDEKYIEGHDNASVGSYSGDDPVIETASLGGISILPAIQGSWVLDLSHDKIKDYAQDIRDICESESSYDSKGLAGFDYIPYGIDVIKVVELGTVPHISAQIMHRQAGTGRIGTGIIKPRMDAFHSAVLKLSGSKSG